MDFKARLPREKGAIKWLPAKEKGEGGKERDVNETESEKHKRTFASAIFPSSRPTASV
jgi:hypothetical protein